MQTKAAYKNSRRLQAQQAACSKALERGNAKKAAYDAKVAEKAATDKANAEAKAKYGLNGCYNTAKAQYDKDLQEYQTKKAQYDKIKQLMINW